jgi:cobalt-zinc-cadmium efflux system protein
MVAGSAGELPGSMTDPHHHHEHDHHHGHAGHSHGHAGHSHGTEASELRLTIALLILGGFTVVEALGGYFANSIALLAEAAHMLADSASLLLAIVAIRVARRPASVWRTYGHRRYQPLAAFVNGQVLLLLTAWVVYEAVSRIMASPRVNGRLMLEIALIGGAANLAALVALAGGRSLNERGARAHVLSDLLGAAAASVAAVVIIASRWTLADPLLSLVVSALILRSAWGLTRESAHVLLEGAPAGCDEQVIESELVGHVPGLIGVHHVHVWSMTGERPTVTLHANLAAGSRHGEVIAAINARLEQRLQVEHTTVQIEEEGDCETPGCGPDGHPLRAPR